MEIKAVLREFIEKNLISYDNNVILKDDDNIFTLGFVNSLFAVRLVNFIETKFKINIEPDDLDLNNFSSLLNMEQLIRGKV